MTHSSGKRGLLAAVATAGTLAVAAREASAQGEASTWQRIQDSKVVRLAAAISEPFAFKDLTNSDKPGGVRVGDTTWRGLAPACAKEIAEALGVGLQMVDTTWGNAVAGLQANQFDFIIGLDGTPKRAAVVDFVPQPLFMYGTGFLTKEGTDISTWTAINGARMRVGVPVGTTMEQEITRRAPDAQLTRFQGIPEMIAAFQAGRVDAISSSITSMTLASARLPRSAVAMPAPPALFPVSAGIRLEADPRWRNFLGTSFTYLSNSGFVQRALNEAYAFRGVDVDKLQPVSIR